MAAYHLSFRVFREKNALSHFVVWVGVRELLATPTLGLNWPLSVSLLKNSSVRLFERRYSKSTINTTTSVIYFGLYAKSL